MLMTAGVNPLETEQITTKLKVKRPQVVKLAASDDILKYYKLGPVIGQGCFGIVHDATRKSDTTSWAIKIMNKTKAGQSRIQQLEREINILNTIEHKHIIHLEELFETPKKYFMVLEKCHGELYDEFMKNKKLPETDCKIVIKRLVEAIAYLHKIDIVHRDIKLENILIGSNPKDPDDELYVKLTDFGLSAVKSHGVENMLTDCCGSLQYMAPEVIENKRYSHQCDVWSVGVLMYLLLTGVWPFYSQNQCEQELCRLILQETPEFDGWQWKEISQEAVDLIKQMLKKNPAFRITAAETLSHPWITEKNMGQPEYQKPNVLELMKMWNEEARKSTLI